MGWLNLFVVANVVQFSFGIAITAISYRAYLSSGGNPSYRNSTIGFLCITIGGVLAPIYELLIKSNYSISGQELLKLQIIEGAVIGVGLAFLLFSVYSYNAGTDPHRRVEVDVGRETSNEER